MKTAHCVVNMYLNKTLLVAPGMIQTPESPLHIVILCLVMEFSSHFFNKLKGMIVRGIPVLEARLCWIVRRILWLDTSAKAV